MNRRLLAGIALTLLSRGATAADAPASARPGPHPPIELQWSDGSTHRVVWRPGLTLFGALLTRGGFTSWDRPGRVTLERAGRTRELDIHKLGQRFGQAPTKLDPLQPGDRVICHPRKFFSF